MLGETPRVPPSAPRAQTSMQRTPPSERLVRPSTTEPMRMRGADKALPVSATPMLLLPPATAPLPLPAKPSEGAEECTVLRVANVPWWAKEPTLIKALSAQLRVPFVFAFVPRTHEMRGIGEAWVVAEEPIRLLAEPTELACMSLAGARLKLFSSSEVQLNAALEARSESRGRAAGGRLKRRSALGSFPDVGCTVQPLRSKYVPRLYPSTIADTRSKLLGRWADENRKGRYEPNRRAATSADDEAALHMARLIAHLRTVFDEIDLDHGGTLDKDELREALSDLGKSQSAIDKLLASLDHEALDFDQFVNLVLNASKIMAAHSAQKAAKSAETAHAEAADPDSAAEVVHPDSDETEAESQPIV